MGRLWQEKRACQLRALDLEAAERAAAQRLRCQREANVELEERVASLEAELGKHCQHLQAAGVHGHPCASGAGCITAASRPPADACAACDAYRQQLAELRSRGLEAALREGQLRQQAVSLEDELYGLQMEAVDARRALAEERVAWAARSEAEAARARRLEQDAREAVLLYRMAAEKLQDGVDLLASLQEAEGKLQHLDEDLSLVTDGGHQGDEHGNARVSDDERACGGCHADCRAENFGTDITNCLVPLAGTSEWQVAPDDSASWKSWSESRRPRSPSPSGGPGWLDLNAKWHPPDKEWALLEEPKPPLASMAGSAAKVQLPLPEWLAGELASVAKEREHKQMLRLASPSSA
eukprot:SM000112S23956  [mRNA]  locus=s112:62346:63732:+ [translate_table: standard]